MSAPAWDTERAAALARKAYGYVAAVFYPEEAGYETLDEHTEAAYQAESAGDLEAFEDALRGLMRTALEVKAARRDVA